MNPNTSALPPAAAGAKHFVDAARPRLRDVAHSGLEAIKPVLALAAPLARRVNWRMVAFGLVAGVAGYLIRAGIGSAAERKARAANGKPHEVNRWENEGGMIATSTPAVTSASSEPSERPVDAHGDVGAGSGEPPINS